MTTPGYLAHFNLREPPFAPRASDRYFYLGHQHREATSFLERALGAADLMIGLTGEPGVGKTATVDHVLAHSWPRALVARISRLDPEPGQFLGDLLAAFGFQDLETSREEARGLVGVFLGHQRQKGVTTIITVENPQAVSAGIVEELGWMSLLEPVRMGRLKVVLIGSEILEHQLAAPRMQALRQMIRWQHRLESLTEDEGRDYLEFRLEAAGSQKANEVFAADAAQRIHRVACGLPARINRLANAALQAAASAGAPAVAPEHVVAGSDDLKAAVRSRERRQRTASLDIALDRRPLGRIGLTSPRMLVGRHPWNDIQLDDESVSRHHALLVREGGYWTVVDLNSTNGIRVNDKDIRQQRLRHGDTVCVGRFRLQLREGRGPEAELPTAGDFGATVVLSE